MNKKILILYATHEISDNLLFFCRNGYIEQDNHDFIFIFNNPTLKINFLSKKPNVRVINRVNIGIDFGAWTETLLKSENNKLLYQNYDYFILINSTIRGPFLTPEQQQQKILWTDIFINKLDEKTKLVGSTINLQSCGRVKNYKPHVQSMLLVTDRIGLEVGIKHKIFNKQEINMNKHDIITKKEIGFSTAILENNYNIACLSRSYNDIDFRSDKTINKTNFREFDNVCSMNPLAVIFIKNRYFKELLKNITPQFSKPANLSFIKKISYGPDKLNAIDVTSKLLDYLSKGLILHNNININQLIGTDPSFGIPKKLFIYCNNIVEPTLVMDELSGKLSHNLLIMNIEN